MLDVPIMYLGQVLGVVCIESTTPHKWSQLEVDFAKLISALYAFSYSPRFVGIMINFFSKFYRCYLTSFLAVTIDYHSNIINIIILFDRLSIFIKKLKVFKNLNPLIISILTLLLCTSINLPSLFRYQINLDLDLSNSSNRTNQTMDSTI
jgi:hypothetical protein